jgi:hypothetical protein
MIVVEIEPRTLWILNVYGNQGATSIDQCSSCLSQFTWLFKALIQKTFPVVKNSSDNKYKMKNPVFHLCELWENKLYFSSVPVLKQADILWHNANDSGPYGHLKSC